MGGRGDRAKWWGDSMLQRQRVVVAWFMAGAQCHVSPWASENVAATVTLLDKLPKVETPSEWKTHQEIQDLLGLAVQQQAESSMSRRHEPETNCYVVSTPTTNDATSR